MAGLDRQLCTWSAALAAAVLWCAAPAWAQQADDPAAVGAQPASAAPQADDPLRVPAHSPASMPDTEPVLPVELTDVELVEKLGQRAELGLSFTDSSGRQVVLADYFDGNTPVILNLTYFRCPMSCPVILQNLSMSLRQIKLDPGVDYKVVTVSIDPTDTVAAALTKQRDALEVLRHTKPDAGPDAWPFLVGSGANSRALAESVGYGYKYLPGPRQYTHKDVIIILSPDGTITRYLAGRTFPKVPLELTLVEASQGKIGSPADHFKLLFCYYDTGEKKYALRARRIMTAGGALTLATLAGVLGLLWVKEIRKPRAQEPEAEA